MLKGWLSARLPRKMMWMKQHRIRKTKEKQHAWKQKRKLMLGVVVVTALVVPDKVARVVDLAVVLVKAVVPDKVAVDNVVVPHKVVVRDNAVLAVPAKSRIILIS